MPKVSLILPIYNVEPYIAECLDSLVNQTLEDIEIICVNDASPDKSWDIVQKYAQTDKRFVLINLPENHGQGHARNVGIDAATGEYIMFVDPDDWLELNACELAYNQIKQNNNDFVYFGMYWYNEENKQDIKAENRLTPFVEYGNKNLILQEISKPFLSYGESVYKIYKRHFVTNNHIRFLEQRFCEDIPFYIQCVVKSKDVSVLNEYLYHYRIRNNSSTSFASRWKELFIARNACLDYINVNNNLTNAYIVAYVRSLLYWYNKFTTKDSSITKPFYKEMRKSFQMLDKQYDVRSIKEHIDFSEFKKITKNSWIKKRFKETLKNIFSVTNSADKSHKVIKIFGIKVKYKRSFKLFSITKSKDRHYKVITILGVKIKINREKRKIAKTRRQYIQTLAHLRKEVKTRKLKVAFLINEVSKWKYQSLYDILEKSDKFAPYIAITLADYQQFKDKEYQTDTLNKTYNYFLSKKFPSILVWDIEKGAMNVDADIIFYEQPWAVDKKQFPSHVSKYALTFYIPYFIPNYGILKMDYQYFHKCLYRYYVLNQNWKKIYQEYAPEYAKNVYSAGHTQLDAYLHTKINKNYGYVIYAPHWSIKHPRNKQPENYSTFLKNGQEILAYAKQHPEINWVFKPHPTLKRTLQKIGWSTEKVESYYNEWEKIAKCCYDADYVELFLQSKAMITDCGSFLIEYFVTGKPLIHLISDDCKEVPLEPSKVIFDTFYKAQNLEEMYQHFQDIIIEDNDYLKETRLEMLEKSQLKGNNAAQNIYDDLLNVLNLS